MAVRFTYQGGVSVPVEVEGLVPDRLAGLTVSQIERQMVAVGNRELPVAELFRVTCSLADDRQLPRLEFEGDLRGVHRIGWKMQAGEILVIGSAGRHVGSEMSGGSIVVEGDVGDWLGAELQGGRIHVRGNAAHLVGAAYRGSRRGMTGGQILIDGSVGNELGHTMRRGLIAVGGSAGDLIGFQMLAGTILVFGDVGIRHGAGMKRGTIGLLGGAPCEMLSSFRFACRYRPLAFDLVIRSLQTWEFSVPDRLQHQELQLYHGDFLAGGRGELWLASEGTSA